ncbi:MAG: prepilin-type N-terminal cleavage/methylation domain-containing protein [Opitutaceae bacterium]|jgi:prepilin-type N-terminal cleavage/methylation domain-containing protein/prepilin-type processing-associated H-X9-DG protein|nr:prepilin-type N-terminal cleavage/methylation domain-containing protein [Opitutaceae bacterium]
MNTNTSTSPFRLRHHAFTLVELLTVIAIIGILAAIMIPTLGAVRSRARIATCASNLRQLAIGAVAWASDNKGWFPELPHETGHDRGYSVWGTPGGKATWQYMGVLHEQGYVPDMKAFYCPVALEGTFDYQSQWIEKAGGNPTTSAQMFRIGYRQRTVEENNPAYPRPGFLSQNTDATYVLAHDFCHGNNQGHPSVPGGTVTPNNRPAGINIAFSDGHVKYSKEAAMRYWYYQYDKTLYDVWEAKYK